MIKDVGGIRGSIDITVDKAQKNIKALKNELKELQNTSNVFSRSQEDIPTEGYKALLKAYTRVNKETRALKEEIDKVNGAIKNTNASDGTELSKQKESLKQLKEKYAELKSIQKAMKTLKANSDSDTDFLKISKTTDSSIARLQKKLAGLESNLVTLKAEAAKAADATGLDKIGLSAEEAAKKIERNRASITRLKADIDAIDMAKSMGKDSAMSSLAMDLEMAEMNYDDLKEAAEDARYAIEQEPDSPMVKTFIKELNELEKKLKASSAEVKLLNDVMSKLERTPITKYNISSTASAKKIKALEEENDKLVAIEEVNKKLHASEKARAEAISNSSKALKDAAIEAKKVADTKNVSSAGGDKPATPIVDNKRDINAAIELERQLADKLKESFKNAGGEIKGVSSDVEALLIKAEELSIDPYNETAVDSSKDIVNNTNELGKAADIAADKLSKMEDKVVRSSNISNKMQTEVAKFAKRLKHLGSESDEATYNQAFKLSASDYDAAKNDVNVLAKMMTEAQRMAVETRKALEELKAGGKGFSSEATDMSNYYNKVKAELIDLKKIELGTDVFNEEALMAPFSGSNALGKSMEEQAAKTKATLDKTASAIYDLNAGTDNWFAGLTDVENVLKTIYAYSTYDMALIDSDEVNEALEGLTKLVNRGIAANESLRSLAQEGSKLLDVTTNEDATIADLEAVDTWATRATESLNTYLNTVLKTQADRAFAKPDFAEFGLSTKGVNFNAELREAEYSAEALIDTLLGLNPGLTDLGLSVDNIDEGLKDAKRALEGFSAPLHDISRSFTNIKTDISDATGLIRRAAMEWDFYKEKQKSASEQKLLGPGEQITKWTPKMDFDFSDINKGSSTFKKNFVDAEYSSVKTKKELYSMRKLFSELSGQAKRTSFEFDRIARASAETNGSMKDVARVVQGIIISQTFYKMLNQVQSMIGAIKDAHLLTEQIAVSFGSMFNDFDMGNAFIKEIQKFAAVTPFEFQDVAKNARLLSAYGFTANEILPIMERLSDASAAMGDPEALTRVTRALGQVRTKGRLMQEELRQLNEAGINTSRILTEELGLTKQQLADIGRQKIPASTAIAAILRGIEKQFGGSAEALSKTGWGLLSTISDNVKLIGMEVTSGMYNSFKGMLSTITDKLLVTASQMNNIGFGGWLDKNFSAETVSLIRNAAANISMFIDNIKRLWKAISPVVTEIARLGMTMFNFLMPIINGINRLVIELVTWFTNLSPVVSRFIAVLTGLFVAQLAARALMALRTAVAGLFIVQAVKSFVLGLASALKILTLACMKNPWIALLTIGAGVLSYFALQSDFAAKMVAKLSGAINGLFGNSPSKYIAPKAPSTKDWGDWVNEVGKGEEALDNLGKEAEDAGKKAKNSLASFDEVFTLNLDDGTDKNPGGDLGFTPSIDMGSLDDIISGWEAPEIDIPIEPEEESEGLFTSLFKSIGKSAYDIGSFIGTKILPLGAIADTIIIPFYMLADVMDTTKQHITMFAKVTWASLKEMGTRTLTMFSEVKDHTVKAFGEIKDFTVDAIGKMSSDTAAILGPWWENTKTGFVDWATSTKDGIVQWGSDTWSGISQWGSDTWASLSTWWGDTTGGFGEWATNTWSGISTWWGDTCTLFSDWKNINWDTISKWASDTWSSISQWGSDTWTSLSTWWGDTTGGFGDWWTTTTDGISDWASNTWGSISQWGSDTWGRLSSWWGDTEQSFSDWKTAICGTVTDWWSNTSDTISQWGSDTWSSITSWWTDIGKTFTDWKEIVGDIWDSFWDSISTICGGWMTKLGDSWKDFINGWKDGFSWLGDQWDKFWGKTSKAPEIQGPPAPQAASYSLSYDTPDLPKMPRGPMGFAISPVQPIATALAAEAPRLRNIPSTNALASGTVGRSSATTSATNSSSSIDIEGIVSTAVAKAMANMPTPVYAGTVVADERSLKELSRKINIISKNDRRS